MCQSHLIKSLAPEERPYEKCTLFGACNLTNMELLAILLRTGSKGESSLELAKKILRQDCSPQGLLQLHSWSKEQLCQIRGIGQVKASQIESLLELAKRLAKEKAKESLCFSTPKSIAWYYMEDLRHQSQETVKLVLLNGRNHLITDLDISKGSVHTTVITPRELFVEALKKEAVSIILLHNHPSGDPKPSKEDILLTKRVLEAGRILGIELLDHIVIGNNNYVSLREKGLI